MDGIVCQEENKSKESDKIASKGNSKNRRTHSTNVNDRTGEDFSFGDKKNKGYEKNYDQKHFVKKSQMESKKNQEELIKQDTSRINYDKSEEDSPQNSVVNQRQVRILNNKIQENLQNFKLPRVQIKFKNVESLAVIDSGSEISLLSLELYNQLRKHTENNIKYITRGVTLLSFTQQPIKFINCIRINFKLGNKSFSHSFFVSKDYFNENFQVLIGYDLMSKYPCKLDTENHVLKFGHEEVNLIDDKNINQQDIMEYNNNLQQDLFNITAEQDGTKIFSTDTISKDLTSKQKPIFQTLKYNELISAQNLIRNKQINANRDRKQIKSIAKSEQAYKKISEAEIAKKKMYEQSDEGTAIKIGETCIENKDYDTMDRNNQKVNDVNNINNEINCTYNKNCEEQQMTDDNVVNTNDKHKLDKRADKKMETKSKNTREEKQIYAILKHKTQIQPGESVIEELELTQNFEENTDILLTPVGNANQVIQDDIVQNVLNGNKIKIILYNQNMETINLNKNMKIGLITTEFKIQNKEDTENHILRVNKITAHELKKMHDLRKKEIQPEDFEVEHLSSDLKKVVIKMLIKNSAAFSKSYATLGSTDEVIPKIELSHKFPIASKPYPIPRALKEIANQEIQNLLKHGLIQKSESHYASPVILVKKQTKPGQEAKYRLAIDFRAINNYLPILPVALPRIQELLQSIAGNKIYTTMDLKAAFFQIQLRKEDCEKLTMILEQGSYFPTVLPFGLKNSGAYFQLLMNKVLGDLADKKIYYYLDDVVLGADSEKEMLEKMQIVFDRLIKANLTLEPAKMQIMKQEIQFLGYTISKEGISPSDKNCAKIQNYQKPKTVKQIKSFLGATNYFRNLIKEYALIAQPLIDLTKKGAKFNWTKECERSFEKLKQAIFSKPVMRQPDEAYPYHLITDGSPSGISAILSQVIDGQSHVIAYFSRALKASEKRYAQFKVELLGIYAAMMHFKEYLYGKHFTLLSDARSLMFHTSFESIPNIMARWLLQISQFSFDFRHQKGEENPCDYSSRYLFDQEEKIKLIQNINVQQVLNNDVILKEQFEDKKLSKIRIILNKGKRSFHTRKEYFINSENNLLMVKKLNLRKQHMNEETHKIVIPNSLKGQILNQAHMAHFGAKKTYEILSRNYFWTNAYSDTVNFCKSCKECLLVKQKNIIPTEPQAIQGIMRPGQYLQIDFVGKLPKSTNGNVFVLTVIDTFSRHLEVYPIKDMTAKNLINRLTHYVTQFGCPQVIHSDNGGTFRSQEYINWTDALNIERRYSSIYHAQSLGRLERAHKILKESVMCIARRTFNWDQAVIWFKLFHNNTINPTTKYEPAYLFFSRQLTLPLENINQKIFKFNEKEIDIIYNNVDNYKQYVEQQCKIYNKIVSEVKENQQRADEKRITEAKRIRKEKFSVGDIVYLRKFIKPLVLQDKFTGPYEIISIGVNNNYEIRLKDENNSKIIRVHANNLIKAQERREYLKNQNVQQNSANEKYKDNTSLQQTKCSITYESINDTETEEQDNQYNLRSKVFVNTNYALQTNPNSLIQENMHRNGSNKDTKNTLAQDNYDNDLSTELSCNLERNFSDNNDEVQVIVSLQSDLIIHPEKMQVVTLDVSENLNMTDNPDIFFIPFKNMRRILPYSAIRMFIVDKSINIVFHNTGTDTVKLKNKMRVGFLKKIERITDINSLNIGDNLFMEKTVGPQGIQYSFSGPFRLLQIDGPNKIILRKTYGMQDKNLSVQLHQLFRTVNFKIGKILKDEDDAWYARSMLNFTNANCQPDKKYLRKKSKYVTFKL